MKYQPPNTLVMTIFKGYCHDLSSHKKRNMKIQIWSLAQVPLNDLTIIQLLKHMEKTNVEWLLKTKPNLHQVSW
jgi:hypothetical protein